ncbi:MAG: response regulator [Lachnospiraceae bacterium]|nr:response regulator [Lachnospiraceae bacterium]
MAKETKRKIPILVPMIIIFCMMVGMVVYTSRTIRDVAVANVNEVGEDRISAAAAGLENYLEMTKSTLWVTADSVDHMSHNGATSEEILRYITEESTNQEQYFDENYTGIYGFVGGEYLDGVGWVPPEDYDPTQRDWYRDAIKAGGETTIVSPYVDAQTGAVIISISRMLSNGKDVLSLDVTMNHIQDMISELQIKEKGYGFIVNNGGLLIAHRDETKKGQYLNKTEEEKLILNKIKEVENGNFELETGGRKNTYFVRKVLDQWYAVIVVSSRELYAEMWKQLIINIVICSLIYLLIFFFYYFGYVNEKNYSKRIEEMFVEEQNAAYEAKALKLEKESADRANKAKSDFLAEMSHEIRTPINAVLGMNEMILRESYFDERSSYLDRASVKESFDNIRAYSGNIASAGNNLLSIINDILDFSKIESGKLEIVNAEYQFSSVLNDVSNMIYYKAKDKDLDFTVDVDETLPDGLFGDEVRVRQIITNILNNAVKYTREGGVRFTVRGKRLEDSKVALTISVKDTGIGIKSEDIDKLFTKFQRVDLKSNSAIEGTGLGLAITKSLLDMMNGSIRVESEYGSGSDFIIDLTQTITSDEAIGNFQNRFRQNMIESKAYTESFRAPSARILIVDDTKMNLKVVIGLLRDTLIKIDTADSGEESVEMCKKTTYDAILMDQRMPNMDGSEALKLIRAQADGANTGTPIICMTADAVVGAKERYLAEGFTDYITKPIDSMELEHMLMKYLPDEKMESVEKRLASDERVDQIIKNDPVYVKLAEAGFNIEEGLKFCQYDDELYKSILLDYAQGRETRLPHIISYYENKDWKNYAVSVHALKSSSKTIGIKELADIAALLESAANKGESQTVEAKHDRMIGMYKARMEEITEALGDSDAPDINMHEEGDVLEFLPEDG